MEISIPTDENGLLGRECPDSNCQGYFKVKYGTGLSGDETLCHCPYCGHAAPHDQFWTRDQIAYVESVMGRWAEKEIDRAMRRALGTHHQSGRSGITTRWVPGRPRPIRTYSEKELETPITCSRCTLEYAIYGVFGWCPDCADHNSQQILETNLRLVEKLLDLSTSAERDLAKNLIENALEDVVSALDAYGRELCGVAAVKRGIRGRVRSLQSLTRARDEIINSFGVDISSCTAQQEWSALCRSFQKRHLITHKLGVVDQEFLRRCGEPSDVLGRRIVVNSNEVRAAIGYVRAIGQYLYAAIG